VKYLSVCSGIEAATVAWGPLGWEAVAYAEIEPFASAVLAHYYPTVPNLGDIRKINGADFRGLYNVLVGGTPCQSFSVAGLRLGLDDDRGNLALEFVRIADESDPDFIVWENVPGVLSDRGNAYGHFLGALAGEGAPLEPPRESRKGRGKGKQRKSSWTDAGYVLGPKRSICWRVLDAQYFALAQRRRRVFLVACPRGGADPRQILFEFDGLRRDSAPGRGPAKEAAGTPKGRSGSCGRGDPAVTGGPPYSRTGNARVEAEALVISKAIGGRMNHRNPTHETYIAGTLLHNRKAAGSATIRDGAQVRQLTPRECERLQGFPDDYTLVEYKGKPAADGPRYKGIGLSMPTTVMRWIGERIQAVAGLIKRD
jgi:DNA (cytosine-5)-methyltransferase 1